MGDRRVLSSLVTIGLIASLVLPTSVSFAASPNPTPSDPKASGTEGVSVLAATASSTISVSGGPLTITINNELNCDVDHAADPLHGEFFGETACATLVAVDGTLFGPSFIPAGAACRRRSRRAVRGSGRPFEIDWRGRPQGDDGRTSVIRARTASSRRSRRPGPIPSAMASSVG